MKTFELQNLSQVSRYQELRTEKRFEEAEKEIERMVEMALGDIRMSDEQKQTIKGRIMKYINGKR